MFVGAEAVRILSPASESHKCLAMRNPAGWAPQLVGRRSWTCTAAVGYIALMTQICRDLPAIFRTSAVTVLVIAACAVSISRGDEPLVAQDDLRQAVTRALPLLQKAAIGHRENRTCFACHNQGIPILALTTARARGFDIDEEELQKQLKFIAEFLSRNRENYLQGQGQGGQVDTAGYALVTLELGGWQADETTAAVTEYLLLYQKDSPHWRTNSQRPPSEASPFTTSYVGLRGLTAFGTAEQNERIAERREKLKEWVLKEQAKDTEDRVFRLRALHALGADKSDIAAASKELADTQQEGGGFRQIDSLEPDAYATGTALAALHQAGEMPTSDPVYQRGLRFLLKTQLEDGSWHVKSRSKPFQAYFESGFPHGKDQFISSAASGWAATALALACEK